MTKWTFEPGHTAAGFRVRHMMVTWVRGHFKNVRGAMEFDPKRPGSASVRVEIDAKELWTGEPDRDAHLKSPDFLDAQKHPRILFQSSRVEQVGANHFRVVGNLTLRGITRPASLDVQHLGQWSTPYWEGGIDKGPVIRAGFTATTTINRHDFEVNWNAKMENNGVVVGSDILIEIDVEALQDKD